MTRVESSHVWEIGYDAEDNTLHVRYWPSVACPEGRLVRYLGVDQKTADAVMNAPSIGSALHAMVKGKYKANR
jgi:KTSC domain